MSLVASAATCRINLSVQQLRSSHLSLVVMLCLVLSFNTVYMCRGREQTGQEGRISRVYEQIRSHVHGTGRVGLKLLCS